MSAGSRKITRPVLRIATLLLLSIAGTQLLSQTNAAQPPMAATAHRTSGEAPTIPAFAVISVKRNLTARGWTDVSTADGYSATGVTLSWVLPRAYGIGQSYRIFGMPEWGDTYRYDIEARVDDADLDALHRLDWKLRYAMVQQILAERFKIKVHREDRVQPIYSLVVVNKDRLRATPPPADGTLRTMGGKITRSRQGQLTASDMTMARFAEFMSGSLGRSIVDNTGLTGGYDFKLDWNPDEIDTSGPGNSAPSIFTAVQDQLGLKLVPATGTVECLVIDHVETPSEN